MTLNSKIAQGISSFIDLFYPTVLERFIPRHTFRYGVCGVANSIFLDTIFYYIIYNYIVCQQPVDLGFYVISPQIAALFMVFPITFLIGFWLNRNVAFQATEEREKRQVSKYALSVCGSIVLSYISLKVLVEVCGIWATPAKTLSSIIVALYSYIAARHFTFRRVDKN
ncbi:MAG: GtrA family protein [Rikenellaceae bacterium]